MEMKKLKLFTLILLAISLLGKPYSFATAGPNTFDCSGFICYCYKEAVDIDLPHSAQQIGYIEEYTTIENIEDLRAGDILCFDTLIDADQSDHLAIYLWNNNFIHCSSGKRQVTISSLEEKYYKNNFSWGKRIFDSP